MHHRHEGNPPKREGITIRIEDIDSEEFLSIKNFNQSAFSTGNLSHYNSCVSLDSNTICNYKSSSNQSFCSLVAAR